MMAKKGWFLALLSAALLLAGLHPLDLTWLSWFGFLPLFLVLFDKEARLRDLLFSTLLAGTLYYGIGFYWLLFHKLWVYGLVVGLVVPAFSIYFLLFRWIAKKIPSDFPKILLAGIQKLYAFTPIGALALEAPFYGPLPFLQIASLAHISTLSGVIVAMNAAFAFLLSKRKRFHFFIILLFILVVGGIYLWGRARLKVSYEGEIPVAVIQHNLPYSGRWRLDHAPYVRVRYRELALEAAKENPRLIIFPLYNFPEDVLRTPDFFLGLAKETQTHILVASHIPKEPGQSMVQEGYINVAVLYSPEGKIVGHYQSIRAAPFGEVPEFTRKEYEILETPFGKLGILLCYEDAVPGVAKKAVEKGADILIALSNPGQFTKTHLPYYHLLQDQLRAIETNRWLVRASANGYSAFVDPRGRIVKKSSLEKDEILYEKAGGRLT